MSGPNDYEQHHGSAFDFIDGQRDCRNGEPAKVDGSEFYTRGYNFEYWCEQQKTERNLKQERNNR